jgi:hypothetical protein
MDMLIADGGGNAGKEENRGKNQIDSNCGGGSLPRFGLLPLVFFSFFVYYISRLCALFFEFFPARAPHIISSLSHIFLSISGGRANVQQNQ